MKKLLTKIKLSFSSSIVVVIIIIFLAAWNREKLPQAFQVILLPVNCTLATRPCSRFVCTTINFFLLLFDNYFSINVCFHNFNKHIETVVRKKKILEYICISVMSEVCNFKNIHLNWFLKQPFVMQLQFLTFKSYFNIYFLLECKLQCDRYWTFDQN